MQAVSNAYLAAAAGQMGAISAFLGGFAATFLATLLIARHPSRAATVTIALAAAAAVAFIVCVMAATTLVSGVHPEAPQTFNSPAYLRTVQALMTLSFLGGVLTLVGAVGAGGWLRSRRMGWATTALAALGLLAVLFLTVRIGA